MKTRFFLIAIAISAVSIATSCKKDEETAKPIIKIMEIGEGDTHGNDHTAIIGGELHVEAEIVADGKIDKVHVKIHPEGDHKSTNTLEEWELDTTYTKFSGLKNTIFHEHLEIDTIAEVGTYHFDFTVTDMEGNQSSAEAELVISE